MKKSEIAIVIAAYNEGEVISDVLEKLKKMNSIWLMVLMRVKWNRRLSP